MYRQQNFFFAFLAALAMTNFCENGMEMTNAMDIDMGNITDIDMDNITDIDMDNITDIDMGNITFYNETDDDDDAVSIDFVNATDDMEEVVDIDCTCDVAGISCTDPADEKACVCEDGDVVCVDMPLAPVEAPETMEDDEPLPPDTEMVEESGSFAVGSMVPLVLSAAGIVAIAV